MAIRFVSISLAALLLSACASVPQPSFPIASDLAAVEGATPALIAAADADHLHASQMAQVRRIAEAEARVDLARARLDLDSLRGEGANNADAREFLAAKRALRDARNVYGPTDTGRPEFGIDLFTYPRDWRRHDRWSFSAGEQDVPLPGSGMPLSGHAASSG